MATPEQQAEIERLNTILQADPEWKRIMSSGGRQDRARAGVAYLKSKGLDVPDNLEIDLSTGQVRADNIWRTLGPALAVFGGTILGGIGLAGAMGGSAAAGAGTGIGSRILNSLPAIGSAAATISQNRANARGAEAGYDLQYDELALRRANAERQRALDEYNAARTSRLDAEDLYDRNQRRSLHGGYLEGVQDVNIQSPSTIPRANITGGLRPSSITGAREIGAEMRSRAMREAMNPTPVAPLRYSPLPELSAPPAPNALDSGLNVVGALGPILPTLFGNRRAGQPTLPPITSTPVGQSGVRSLRPRLV